MILLIDNYDSFSYNLVQFFGTVEPDIKVVRNDECTIDEIRAMKPTHIILSPGPGYPKDAGICEEVIGQLDVYKRQLLFCAFFFRVKKVSIEGNTYYSSREMEEKFQSNIFEKNILTFWLMQKLSLTPDLPFVREYEVNYPSTNEIHIKLYEKSIVAGIAYSNQYIYFDKDGIVLQSSDKAVKLSLIHI